MIGLPNSGKVLQHLMLDSSNTVVLSGSDKRKIAILVSGGQYLPDKVTAREVRYLYSKGFIALDKSKSDTTDRRYQWQTFRFLNDAELDRLEAELKPKPKRNPIIHYTPTGTWSNCKLPLPSSGTENPAHVTCKRCIAQMMPYQREARDLALNSQATLTT